MRVYSLSEIRCSFRLFATALVGYWWAIVIALVLGTVLSAFDLVGEEAGTIPTEIWLTVFLLGVPVATFLAFHKMRVERDAAIAAVDEHHPDLTLFQFDAETAAVDDATAEIKVGLRLENRGDADAARANILAGYAADKSPQQFTWFGEQDLINRITPGQKVVARMPTLQIPIRGKEEKPDGNSHYTVEFDHLIIFVQVTWWDTAGGSRMEESWWTYKLGMKLVASGFQEHKDEILPYVNVKLNEKGRLPAG